jgi:hypothetical protein
MIIALSRRNTNVRSLALSLDEKRKLTGPSEETLRALQAALSKHGYPVDRVSVLIRRVRVRRVAATRKL